ncbi:MAG TPA: hypothetical protein VGY55_06550 [Pirellulales bacterium]|jgi:hypothetical protein|nr:hypothetical protein [Pirellulales bacterium]
MQFTTDILASLVGKKHDLLLQLRDVGQRQTELIEGGEMTQLLKLLSSKQRLLNGLQEIERLMDPYRNQNPAERVWRTPADRDRCAELAGRCEILLAEVVEQEKRSESRLMAHRDRVATQLEGIQQAAVARSAYSDHPAFEFRQLDLSSES